jgi:hypothetical protein
MCREVWIVQLIQSANDGRASHKLTAVEVALLIFLTGPVTPNVAVQDNIADNIHWVCYCNRWCVVVLALAMLLRMLLIV